MSYPQPQADDYATNNYGAFRLNTPLSSPGDIYESPQGAHAFCVGPMSDVANINLMYFDDQAPNFQQFATISPTRSLVGLINSRNEARYSPAQRPGRILCWADDIYDPSFRPRAFASTTDSIEFVPPQLDMIQYFAPLPSLVTPRSDKSFVFQNYKVGAGGRDYIVVPYYGRKYAYIQFTNRAPLTSNSFGIIGVNYSITQNDSPNPYSQETALRVPAGVAANASVTLVVTAQNQGMFDALIFSVTDAGPAPLRVVMSDTGV